MKARQRRQLLPIAEVDCNEIPAKVSEQPIDGRELQQAIDTLGDDFKLVVMMFYFEQRSYREIAESLDVPIGTVMSRLARAKAHLRHRLAEPEQSTKPSATHDPESPYQQPTATRR